MENEHLICEHISVSRKQLWDSCQQAYKFRYHLKIVSDEPEKPWFAYGKLVHKIAEVYVQEQGQKPIEEIATACLNGTIEVEKGQPPVKLSAEYKKKLPAHCRGIKDISDKIGYDGKIEHKFHFDLNPPHQHYITGFIDRLVIRGDRYFILDYKTTKKGNYRKNNNTIRYDLQLRCYARVVQKEFGAKPENIFAALYYLEGNELVSTGFNEASLASAEKELHDAYLHITNTHPNDVYGRMGDQCNRCEYRKICPVFKLT